MKTQAPVIKGKKYIMDILGMGHSGEGIGKFENFTIFIPFALPGEQVEALITEVKKNYAKGKMLQILKKSPERVEAKCEIYHRCGGCQLQHMDYEAQLIMKRQQVVDAIERIGGVKTAVVHPTLGAPHAWNYRNKMQFPIGCRDGEIVIGCYAQGTHTIVQTENCLIQDEANNRIAAAVRGIVKRLNISAYDEKTGRGALRHIIGRVGADSGEIMVVLVTSTDTLPKQEKFVNELIKNIPGVTSIQQNVNAGNTNVIMGANTRTLWGTPTIRDRLDEFSFHISARSFFQVNTRQAEVLYQKAVEYADLHGEETVLDAYCGTGAITLFLAKKAKKVYGIEVVEPAIIDARKNAEENHVQNATFIVGDVAQVMPKLYEEGVRTDVIVVDPPRAGCERKVLDGFAAMRPKRIIYVSCNPASLARDIAILAEQGYKVREVQPVDMFSQTSHVECVCLLVKENVI